MFVGLSCRSCKVLLPEQLDKAPDGERGTGFRVYMGGCQNYDPFLGTPNYVPYYNRDPKRDHNFDNNPYALIKVQVPQKEGMRW